MNTTFDNKALSKISWFIVYLVLFFFPPFGYVLLFVVGENDTKNYTQNSRRFLVVGIISIIFSLFFLLFNIIIMSFFKEIDFFVLLLFIAVFSVGIVIVVKSCIYKSRGRKYDLYCKVIKNSKSGSLIEIAKSVNDTYENTLNIIYNMIDVKVLENCYVDTTYKKIIFVKNNIESITYNKSNIPYPITIKCKNCGGTSIIEENELIICDYCNSALKI